MVLNVGRRFWRRTEAEFDCPESVTFVKHTRREVLLIRMEFKPKWGYLLGNVDELCSPPPAPFERVDVEPVDIGPVHSQVQDDALIERANPHLQFGRMMQSKTRRACSRVKACHVGRKV
jgi:hypothetical protein